MWCKQRGITQHRKAIELRQRAIGNDQPGLEMCEQYQVGLARRRTFAHTIGQRVGQLALNQIGSRGQIVDDQNMQGMVCCHSSCACRLLPCRNIAVPMREPACPYQAVYQKKPANSRERSA
jgi:hypothetical protein